jgi:hypothetical protein
MNRILAVVFVRVQIKNTLIHADVFTLVGLSQSVCITPSFWRSYGYVICIQPPAPHPAVRVVIFLAF